jgi:hypothetical protein
MRNMYEIFDDFEKATSKKERMAIIEKNLSKTLVDVLSLTYHPDCQWHGHYFFWCNAIYWGSVLHWLI